MNETQVIEFLKKATVRSGLGFKVKAVQKDGFGNIQFLKGEVHEQKDGQIEPIEMFWQTQGNAISNVPLKYDLVVEQPISYEGTEQESQHEEAPGGNNPQ